ncbi:MAG: aldo/keto reductase [Isosphaeraceae bacterium]|nr:aldo/keto reductase [Isosphaeraceae bacterium]
MAEHDPLSTHRRGFLKAGAVGSVAALAATQAPAAETQEKAHALPTRVLGRTGEKVTILNLGTFRGSGLGRILRHAYTHGVRCIDTADTYRSEPGIADWLDSNPALRKSIFLVTKDHPKSPKDLIAQLDRRLATLRTDYVDLFLIHGIGNEYPASSLEWPKSKEMKETVEAIKKSGKARFVGFSCHDGRRAEYLEAAADGKVFDVVMIQNTAWLDKNTRLNKAIDRCHAAGIGLISMKQLAGPNPDAFLAQVAKKTPDLIERGITPYGALLHAIWTDERFATACVSMQNTDQVNENTRAARSFEPLKSADICRLREAFIASAPTLCPDCDGRCSLAAGTRAPLGDITRYLTYYERHGARSEARDRFSSLPPEARNWTDADLAAAREACPAKLDFGALLERAKDSLA